MTMGSKPPTSTNPWTLENFKAAAQTTGKPLEIRVAQRFMLDQWLVFPSTYYTDVVSGVARELDVLAEVGGVVETKGRRKLHLIFQALASCKGFRSSQRAVTYSVSHSSIPNLVLPRILGYPETDDQGMHDLAGSHFLGEEFRGCRRVIGFDTYEAADSGLIPKGDRQSKGGEEGVYQGLDSAIKAAVFWQRLQISSIGACSFHLPILVFKDKWVDIPLDDGTVGDPQEVDHGYLMNMYSLRGTDSKPEKVLSVVCAESYLPKLLGGIRKLISWLTKRLYHTWKS